MSNKSQRYKQNSNGNGQSYSNKMRKHSYMIVVDSDEEMVLILKRSLELESGENSINDSPLGELGIDKKVLRLFHKLSPMRKNDATRIIPLSYRQTEILNCIAEGHPNKTIANALGISEQTVKNYVTSIKKKLKANDRTHAVVLAMRNGWLDME